MEEKLQQNNAGLTGEAVPENAAGTAENAPVEADGKVWSIIRNFFLPKLNRKCFIRLGLLVVIAVIVFKFLLTPCVVSGSSMEPTYDSNGLNFCWRGQYWFREPARGDVVIIQYGKKIYFLKRIVAMPGEVVEFRSDVLYIDGEPMDESYVKLQSDWDMKPQLVEEGHYYVVGDNRSMNIAQHQHGAVNAARIIGRPLF